MDKQKANEILVNGMGSLFAEAEIEAQIAELAGISRDELNMIIMNGEEMPECIKKYREQNQKRKVFEEKLITHELKEKGEIAGVNYKPALVIVFSIYPQFQQDYEILKSNGYFTETENGLQWEKSKQSLAEYFGYLPRPRETKKNNVPWKEIERLFSLDKPLKNSFSNNGNPYGKSQSDDYIKIKKLLKIG